MLWLLSYVPLFQWSRSEDVTNMLEQTELAVSWGQLRTLECLQGSVWCPGTGEDQDILAFPAVRCVSAEELWKSLHFVRGFSERLDIAAAPSLSWQLHEWNQVTATELIHAHWKDKSLVITGEGKHFSCAKTHFASDLSASSLMEIYQMPSEEARN